MCLFCQIASGKINSDKIYEDDKNVAFLDIYPRAMGHSLVIPKKHYETFDAMTEEDAQSFILAVHKVTKLVKEKLKASGFNVISNNGKVSGQEVMHVHFHILPRFEEDKVAWRFPPVSQESKDSIANIHRTLVSSEKEE